ncbi:MAG: chromosome partitioning protein ParB [SAR202 cluster bacterium]|nr:chromosome partitioning protein ParB [SAR202 cluster bacterium]
MDVIDLPLNQLKEAPWNANVMDDAMLEKLRESISRYGLVQPLVVRPLGDDQFEVLGGNQRLKVLLELGHASVSCVVVELEDAPARLLSQALNRIAGEDNPGLRAALIADVLESLGKEDVLSLLPETDASLEDLLALAGEDTLAAQLQGWQQAQGARLKHLSVQLTPPQLEVVETALARFLPQAKTMKGENPNLRGNSLYLLCQEFLGTVHEEGPKA